MAPKVIKATKSVEGSKGFALKLMQKATAYRNNFVRRELCKITAACEMCAARGSMSADVDLSKLPDSETSEAVQKR
eukprot:CAMPEP_0203896022 /NCGR_PEP_ID=MMETSP0359-20131031/38801_1 /ASSEMBLY_ACC=CAM_ASM_000338 /TAXON_ID=268821 /ORGANISM="Scrippsiella Hangoei, Strain SHTV-5" /LENGTH=75 /DNA_ID=CAMNT_0050818605 /DNA_START=70 /DNA_END=297 /DNA_ORIENTATION=+